MKSFAFNKIVDYTIGGCLGQPLRSGNWCLPGEEIHILSASYKIHPLCCNSPDDNSNAPDNPTLVKFNIFDLTDDAYKAEIEACEDKTACSVTSKSYESNFINNVYCPNHIHTTNFVALTYSCVKPGRFLNCCFKLYAEAGGVARNKKGSWIICSFRFL